MIRKPFFFSVIPLLIIALLTACGDATPTPAATTVPATATTVPTTNPPTATIAPTTTSAPTSTVAVTTPPTTAPATSEAVSSPVQFVWKSSGDPAKPIAHPFSLAIDSQNNIYVGTIDTSQVQKLDSNGHFLSVLGGPGQEDGQFKFKASANATEVALAIDSQDNLYVSDLNYRVQKFDKQGKFLLKWGSEGKGDGQFQGPIGLAVDNQGNVYVSDIFNNIIQKFDATGKFLTKLGSTGTDDGQFKKLANIALDKQGNLYATDNELNRIQKFDATGKFLAKWGDKNQLDGAIGLAIDLSGNLYVSDKNSIVKYDSNSKLVGRWGKFGSGDGEFNYPTSLTVDNKGNIYVADWMNNRIQKFQPR